MPRLTPCFWALFFVVAIHSKGDQITSFTTMKPTGVSFPYNPGAVFVLWLDPVVYSLSNGSTWTSGAGSFLSGEANVASVSVSGGFVTYTLSPILNSTSIAGFPNGLVAFQDFDNGNHSTDAVFTPAGPLNLQAPIGSANAVLSGFLQLAYNSPTGDPNFDSFASPVGALIPFTETFKLAAGTWDTATFNASFDYAASGQFTLAPEPAPGVMVALGLTAGLVLLVREHCSAVRT